MLTHSHVLDLAITEAILKRGDFGWFGLIGSATKRARFEHRLRDRGIAEEQLTRMVCPIGLPAIAGKQPGIIAVSGFTLSQTRGCDRAMVAPGHAFFALELPFLAGKRACAVLMRRASKLIT